MPRAASLAEYIREKFDLDIVLKKSHSGRYEISLNDALIFSKVKEYRFPTDEEIEQLIAEKII